MSAVGKYGLMRNVLRSRGYAEQEWKAGWGFRFPPSPTIAAKLKVSQNKIVWETVRDRLMKTLKYLYIAETSYEQFLFTRVLSLSHRLLSAVL